MKCVRGSKTTLSTSVKDVAIDYSMDVATVMQEVSSSALETYSAWGISVTLSMPANIVCKILRNTLQCYPYKITYVQELRPAELQRRETFDLQFLPQKEIDDA